MTDPDILFAVGELFIIYKKYYNNHINLSELETFMLKEENLKFLK